jgi:hypothetical protein
MEDFDAWGLTMLLGRMADAYRACEFRILSGDRDSTVDAEFIELYAIKGIVCPKSRPAFWVANLSDPYKARRASHLACTRRKIVECRAAPLPL